MTEYPDTRGAEGEMPACNGFQSQVPRRENAQDVPERDTVGVARGSRHAHVVVRARARLERAAARAGPRRRVRRDTTRPAAPTFLLARFEVLHLPQESGWLSAGRPA